MAKVFISYSRKDKKYAQKLASAMANLNNDTWVDWDDIPPTADWWAQIEAGIEEADAFLFLLSPDSVVSQVCGQEIEHATKNNKRMLPLVVREVDAGQVPASLSHLNWIFFREQDNFDEALQKLIAAIETDLEWVDFHKRLQVRALEWEKQKNKSLLLRGENLREAEEELAGVKQKQPSPTDLQRQYVLQSRKQETRNRNIVLTSASVAAVLLGIAAVIAVVQSIKAAQQANLAMDRQLAAEIAEATAVAAKDEAEAARQEAVTQQQIVFASRLGAVSLETENEKSSEKLLLAIEALKASKGLPNPPVEAEQAMWAALKDMGGTPISANGETFDRMFFTDEDHFITVSNRKILLWVINGSKISSTELPGLQNDDYINPFVSGVSPDFHWFVAAVNTAVYVWDLRALGEPPIRLKFYANSIAFSRDSQQFIAGSWVDGEYQYWVWTVNEWDMAPMILRTNDTSDPEISQSIILSNENSGKLSLLKSGSLPISPIVGVSGFLIPVTGGGSSVNGFIKFSQNDQFIATTSLWSVFVWDRNNLNTPIKNLTYEDLPNEIYVNDQWVANLYTPYDSEPTLVFSNYTDPNAAPIFRRLEGRRIDGNMNPVIDSKGRWLVLATEPVVSLPNATDYPGAIAVINFQNSLDTSFYFVAPHNTQVTAMAFSPADNWLASGDANGYIYLSSFGEQGYSGETRRLRGHDGCITDLVFSPNGNMLLSMDQNGDLRLWDVSSDANQIAVWPTAITFSDKAVTASRFGPNNMAFATGFDNGLVALWNVDDINSSPMLFEGLGSNVQMITFSALGDWLVGGSSDGEVLIWSIDQKREPIRLDMGTRVYEMVVSADEKWLYTVGDDGVQRWAVDYPAKPLFLNGPGAKNIMDIQLSSDGRWLAGYEPDGRSLVLWDIQKPHFDQNPSPTRTFSGVLRYTFSEDSLWLAYSNGITVTLMNLAEPFGAQIILDIYQGSKFDASGLAISPDGQSIAISNGFVISLWTDLAKSQQPLLLSNSNLYGDIFLHFTNDRRWMIAHDNNRIMIWNADNFYATPITLERPRGVNDLRLSPDGRWMSILDDYGVVTLWALDPEKRLDLACQVVGRNFTHLEWLAYFPDKPYRESCAQWPIDLDAMTDIAP